MQDDFNSICVICCAGRKQEIIKLTEQLLTAIATSDFESYTYVCLYMSVTAHASRAPASYQ